MARPQTKKGFVMIALDLFPAIMSAGLSTYAQTVLADVILHCYGPQKAETVNLVGSELEDETGLDRSNARRAIRELVDANIIIPVGRAFALNKDYETWTPKAGPLKARLEGRLLSWIEHAPEGYRKDGKHHVQAPEKAPDRVSIQTHEIARDVSIQTHESSSYVSTQTHEINPPLQPPIEERTRNEEREEREERGEYRSDPQPVQTVPFSRYNESLGWVDQLADQVARWFPGFGWDTDVYEIAQAGKYGRNAIECGFADGYKATLRGEHVDLPRIMKFIGYAEKYGLSTGMKRTGPAANNAKPPRREKTPEEKARMFKGLEGILAEANRDVSATG